MNRLSGNQTKLFGYESDERFEQVFSLLHNGSIHPVGPELIFGKIYDFIGFNSIQEELFQAFGYSPVSVSIKQVKNS